MTNETPITRKAIKRARALTARIDDMILEALIDGDEELARQLEEIR